MLGGVKLIVLFACQSAMGRTAGAAEGPITGVAHALSAVSEAVIGMQFTVGVDTAYHFSGKLYAGLARGHSLQRAVASGRAELLSRDDTSTWYIPTLYLRTEQTDEIRLIGD